ncbi:PspC domain-containing protein [Pseudarthrobacter sp. J75]|uniref:PspC domain-containing protein n=1 Tax=unclassified Pseudarthrobacter TaxID=2647000 RepID=UPI002E80903E|nr:MULTISPECIES: PspC domain-containing protein [unclassified Pseudarthrobacter]MEE2521129.1 PspC domain-containing protein [Pseudarthrobacter sp. J47]MEE2528359.1 PspC domain-containing protein [Pseudarthrobacter sp. J75]
MNTQHPTPEDPADAGSPQEPGPRPSEEPDADSHSGSGSSSVSGSDTQPTIPLPGPTPGQDSGPAGPPPPPRPMPAAPPQDFFGWIRSRGIQRGQDRWVGGVSSGIAARLGIDPIIVRGLFIVLTLFAGIGVLLYGLGWALLPEPDGRIHVQEAGAGRWTGGMTGALITTLLGFGGLGGGFWGGDRGLGGFLWACFWLGLVALVVYLLVDRGRRRTAAADMAGGTAGTNSYSSGSYADGAYAGGSYGTGPYGTGPYGAGAYGDGSYGAAAYGAGTSTGPATGSTAAGAAPYAAPYGTTYGPADGPAGPGSCTPPVPPARPAKPRATGPGAPAVAIAAGTALLAGGGLKLLDAANIINLGQAPNAVVWASAAAVMGLAIVIAGSRGRTSGLLGFFAVIALVVGGLFSAAQNSGRFNVENVSWSPSSVQDATAGFDVTGSRGTVDLTDLDLDAPLRADVVVPLDITASNITVIIPDDVPVRISADMTMGNIQERGSDRGGISTRESSYNTGLPGSALVVSIDGTFSNVTIQEGN